MPGDNTNQLLDRLDEARRQFGRLQQRKLESILSKLASRQLKEAASLIRYHELLLFVRAYPPGAAVLRLAEKELRSFGRRVELLRELAVDLSPLEHPEVSGVANTSVTDVQLQHRPLSGKASQPYRFRLGVVRG